MERRDMVSSCVALSHSQTSFILFNLLLFLLSIKYCTARSTLTSSTPLLQDQTLTSSGEIFQLGFFNSSRNQYVGIWYKQVSPKRVVWVANRENPVTDSTARFIIDDNDGNLKVVHGSQNITLWSTNISVRSNGSVAALLDSGDLVLTDRLSGVTIWESFLHPSDTVLPSTVRAYDLNTGERFILNSWKSENDPSPGIFTCGFSLTSPPQAFVWRNSRPYWRSGQWDKSKFVGVPEMDTDYGSGLSLLDDPTQGTGDLVVSNLRNCSYSFLVLTPEGSLRILCYDRVRHWYPRFAAPITACEVYGACGAYGICQRVEPLVCTCLSGFRPKSEAEWSNGNWSSGCVRQTSLACEGGVNINTTTTDGFLEVGDVKVPDSSDFLRVWDENECRQTCLNNCSCKGYSYPNGIGCLIWTGEDLMDLNVLPFGGQKLYLRLAHSELRSGKKKWIIVLVCLISVAAISLIAAAIYCFIKLRAKRVAMKSYSVDSAEALQPTWRTTLEEQDSLELPMLDFQSILVATNNFDVTKKLGQGGYGPVYKGSLQDGKQVAIKRLASTSVQGIEEFKNEITVISKLQHRNLVKLLAYCIDKEEKILIYEYMPNKSLDTYLFDQARKAELDWARRFNIIHGIARGLLYLHRDSCLRIIHRDLKVSNILLDEKMNPKISDFGLARIFQGTQDLANTSRVVGTLGYMAPEYLLGGVFSEKSDVFSFGILMLEIVGGRKISSFHCDEKHLSLLNFAWESWCETQGLSLVDETLADSFSPSEAMRCLNIALLCVQDHAVDRPAMTGVVSMLNGETKLPEPKRPTFMFQTASVSNVHFQSQSSSVGSANTITQTVMEGR